MNTKFNTILNRKKIWYNKKKIYTKGDEYGRKDNII